MNKQSKKKKFVEVLQRKKIIATVKKMKDIDKVLKEADKFAAVFLLTGSISTIKSMVEALHKKGLPVFIHLEKINGLALDNYGLEFLANIVKPDGVITTKQRLLLKAQSLGLIGIQRVFMVDSEVLENTLSYSSSELKPDIIEIMPSPLYSVIHQLTQNTTIPIITGGLINSVEDVEKSLQSGVIGISTSSKAVWNSDLLNLQN